MSSFISLFFGFFFTVFSSHVSLAQHLWRNAPQRNNVPPPEPPSIQSLDPPILNGVCLIATLNPCVPLAKCVPTVPIVGKAICVCPSGYGGDGKKAEQGGQGCVNVDECRSGLHTCDIHSQECVDTQGSYECRCKSGFAMAPNGKLCLDIDECQQPSLNTCNPETSVCHNLEGSFRCDCKDPTQVVDEVTGLCKDMDECTYMNGAMNPCEQICVDQIGGVSCDCKPGYRLKLDGASCEDINECLDSHLHTCDPHGVISRCINTVGDYNCDCNKELGYQTASDGKTCLNFDECAEFPYICGGGSSCCKDLPPPQRFACTNPTDSPNGLSFLNSLPSLGLLGGFSAESSELASDNNSNARRLAHKMKDLQKESAIELSPSQSSNSFNSINFERRLQGLLPALNNILSRRSSGLTPALRIGRGIQCPNGFILGADLYRNKINQKALNTIKAVFTSSVTNQPIDPQDVADGVVANTNAASSELSRWYSKFASMPLELVSAAGPFTNIANMNPFSAEGSSVSADASDAATVQKNQNKSNVMPYSVIGAKGVAGAAIGAGLIADKVHNCGIDDNFCNRTGLTKRHAYGLPKL